MGRRFQPDLVMVEKAMGVKCPRCWKVTGEGRFNCDGLCDGCCGALVCAFPAHPLVGEIQLAYNMQRKMTPWRST